MDYVVEIKGVIRRHRGLVSEPAVVNRQIQIASQEFHRFVHIKDRDAKAKTDQKRGQAALCA